jgi:hypothetical protein
MVRGKEDGIYLKFRSALKLLMEETLERKPVV